MRFAVRCLTLTSRALNGCTPGGSWTETVCARAARQQHIPRWHRVGTAIGVLVWLVSRDECHLAWALERE